MSINRKKSGSSGLEREAADMESRLQLLRSKMSELKEEDDKLPRKGGARWKSARDDRGSVGNYGKEVVEKLEANKDRPKLLSEPKDPKSQTAPLISKEKFLSQTKVVAEWRTSDVSVWLDSIGMGQYKELFKKNDINGAVLLEVSLEDLDYMKIAVLGHRKIIIKEVEDLRNRRHMVENTADLIDSPVKVTGVASATTNVRVDGGGKFNRGKDTEGTQPKVNTVHWSALEPLLSPDEGSKSLHGGLLDDDDLEEEAERAAFTAAVMQWRQGGGNSEKQEDGVKMIAQKVGPSDRVMYVTRKRTEILNAQDDAGSWRNPFVAKAGAIPNADRPDAEGKILGAETLDEAKEHKEFVKAVSAWREGRSSSSAQLSRDKVQALVTSLEAEYTAQTIALQERHAMAVSSLTAAQKKANTLSETSTQRASNSESEGTNEVAPESPVASAFFAPRAPRANINVGKGVSSPFSTSITPLEIDELQDENLDGVEFSNAYAVEY